MMLLYISLFIAIAFLGGMLYWYTFWKAHAVRFSTSGYTPPATSIFGKFWFNAFSRFLVFATVGRVKVVGKTKLPPRNANVIFASNHQLPVDFAMLRLGAGRHFRMLTIANELGGFFGVISAFVGVISVVTGKNGEGAMAEAACVNVVASPAGSLGIFPQGALLPNNVLRQREFRPGIVRMGKAALNRLMDAAQRYVHCANAVDPQNPLPDPVPEGKVLIVPMGVFYRHDPAFADWTHVLCKKTRSMFLGIRNPKHWNPIFKQPIEELPEAERPALEKRREEALRAYRRSQVTNYGGVVVIGDPIDVATLPDDPLQAVEVVRLVIANLLQDAQQR
jgi:1-acyl-sn-glycerol-3-phosphate acyltransferase